MRLTTERVYEIVSKAIVHHHSFLPFSMGGLNHQNIGGILISLLTLIILRKPASWLVAVCERSENRGCGGGDCRKGTKSRRAPVLSARKRNILLDYVPLGNLLTVGIDSP